MLFALDCTDKPDAFELRAATRPAHLEYLNRLAAQLMLAGPVSADGKPVGSLLIIEAESQQAAEEFVAADPYALAGLFAQVRVRPFRVVFQDGKQVA